MPTLGFMDPTVIFEINYIRVLVYTILISHFLVDLVVHISPCLVVQAKLKCLT